MKLTDIHIESVKCFEDYTLDLMKPGTGEPLNVCVLVGPNGCGKSTVMESVVSAFTIADADYGGKILSERAIKFGEDNYNIKLHLNLNSREKELIKSDRGTFCLWAMKELVEENDERSTENFLLYPEEIRELPDDEADEARKTYESLLKNFLNEEEIGCILYFDAFRYMPALNPNGINTDIISNVRKDSLKSNVDENDKISSKYFNVKQWLVNLDYLALKEEGNFYKQVYEHVHQAMELLFQPLKLEVDASGRIVFHDDDTEELIDIDMLSDGFKSLFSIIGAMIMRLSMIKGEDGAPFYMNEAIVLIDEIDCHIHPKWQRNLVPGLKKLFPNCQYIVSTHSPYILESVQEYEIRKIGEKKIV